MGLNSSSQLQKFHKLPMSSHKKLPSALQVHDGGSQKPYMPSQKSDDRRQQTFGERRVSHNNTRPLRSINENAPSTVQLRLGQQPGVGTAHPSTQCLKSSHKNVQSKTSTNLGLSSTQAGAQKSQRSFLTTAATR